jgi:uncharacterized protein (TIGR02118 family)
MLKFIVVLCRRPDLSVEEFQDYFRRVHGPLAEQLPGLRRYVRNYPAPDPVRSRPAWDCVVELYFDDQESMEAAWSSAEGERADADLREFADLARTTWSVVELEVIR